MNNVFNLKISSRCNQNCIYCNEWNSVHEDFTSVLLERLHRVVDMINEFTKGKEWIPSIVGGEPTYWNYEFQEAILNEVKDCKKYLLFTNGFDMSAPLYKDKRAIPYVHLVDYTDLNKVSFILDKIKETGKKEWYACTVVTHQSVSAFLKYVSYMKEKEMHSRIYTQFVHVAKGSYLQLTEEDIRRICEYFKVLGISLIGETGRNYSPELSEETKERCWKERALNIEINKNIIGVCGGSLMDAKSRIPLHEVRSLESLYNLPRNLALCSKCTSPIHGY